MQVWDTTEVGAREQFAFWREVICEAFCALDPSAGAESDFSGKVGLARLASMRCARVDARPHLVRREMREIRRDPQEAFFVNLQLGGSCVTRQDGRESLVRPGDIAVLDLTRPYTIDVRDDFSILCFRQDRARLLPLVSDPTRLAGAVLNRGDARARVAGDLMRSLWADAPALASTPVEDAFGAVLGVALGGRAPADAGTTLRAAQAVVARSLADPRLCPDAVARALRISVRTLHKAFADSGCSFGTHVREQRLARCAAALRNPADRRSASAIAWRWGFSDPAHFSRAFRAAYGLPPRSFRAEARERARNPAD